MADAKISQLPVATTPLAGTELVPVVQGGVTDQTTVEAILTGTVPSGTANGVLYLDGSKVVTSGSALTFDGTKLNASSSADAPVSLFGVSNATTGGESTLNIAAASTQYAFPAVRGDTVFRAEANSLVFGTASEFKWGTSGAELMRLTSTGLGIGTSSPATQLHLYKSSGTVALTTQSGTNYGYFANDGTYAYLGSSVGSTGVKFRVALGAPDNAATLDSSGNLGLGVTPSAWGTSSQAAMQFVATGAFSSRGAGNTDSTVTHGAYYDGTNWRYIDSSVGAARYQMTGANAGSTHSWSVAAGGTAGNAISFTQAMTLDANGNLGVGTTSPNYRLHLAKSGGVEAILSDVDGGGSTQGRALTLKSPTVSRPGYVGTETGHDLAFYTGNTERARIPAAGGMVVGTAALATTATDGFLYVPTCAGTPTGTPTTQTGTAPIVVDTTNNKLYFYSGGQWRDAGP